MIYKVVAVISVIFLIIFGLVVYSAVTLPAKTLVNSTSAGSQQVISTQQLDSSMLSSIPRPAAQPTLGLQESLFVLENRTPTGESLFVYRADPQISSESLMYGLPQIFLSARLSNQYSPLILLNQA
jgi:hypothetical protein